MLPGPSPYLRLARAALPPIHRHEPLLGGHPSASGLTSLFPRISTSFHTVGHRELKKNGVFVLPGFAKFVVMKKPARPARRGINPFTKLEQMFAAKPASKSVRARPVKAIKDAVG